MIPGALYLLSLRLLGGWVVVTVTRIYSNGDVQVSHSGPEWTWAGLVHPSELTPVTGI